MDGWTDGWTGKMRRLRLTPSIPSCACVPFVFVVAIAAEALSWARAGPPICRRLSAVVEALSREPPPTLASERESSWAAFARDRAGGIAYSVFGTVVEVWGGRREW